MGSRCWPVQVLETLYSVDCFNTQRVPKGNFIMGFNKVLTKVGIVLSFLHTIQVSILMRISHFFVSTLIFNSIHGPIYYARTLILGWIVLVSTWFRTVLTQIRTWVYEDSLNLNSSHSSNTNTWCSQLSPLILLLLLIPCIHMYNGPMLVLTICEYKHLENFSPK